MRKSTLIMLFCLIGFNSFAQEENIIALGSEVTFTLSKTIGDGFTYKVTAIKQFNKNKVIITDDVLKDRADTDQVKLYFCKGKFGNDTKTLLIIKNGLKVSLKYNAKIKVGGKDYFENTSVEPLFPNVKSIEEWPYNIDEISLSDFSVMTD